tara:strand:- start:51 stop:1715 length:1665 start_codon:yes stop_codon:yes gene_type:complete
MIDGKIIWYCEEERLSRNKYDGSPLMGLMKVFDYVDHIDELVICHTHRHGPELDWTGEDLYQGFIRKISRGKWEPHITYIDSIHHELHAHLGFVNSGFKTAACVIADGAGSFLTTEAIDSTIYEFETIFKAKWPLEFEVTYKHLGSNWAVGVLPLDEEKKVLVTEYPGIVKMYEAVTMYCGFSSIEAGKTMGLSPYGKPNANLPELFRDNWSSREVLIPDYPNQSRINVQRYPELMKDVEVLTKAHEEGTPIWTQTQKDLAYLCQKESEEQLIRLIRKAHEDTGEKNIVVSGGYGLNCVANYKYWKEFPDLNIYVEPISHDGGTSMGGALYVWHNLQETEEPVGRRESIYYGPQYNPDTYLDDIDDDVEVSDTSYQEVAELIRDENIVTIFQGRSEGGPRALGNRSILFDPTIKDGKDIVNSVKRREFFRPFACSIKEEKVHEWFDLQGRDKTPHMMYAVDCLPGVEEKIPSVIHVDGTCRIQTLTKDDNQHYYNLIDAFEKLSGVPILFNTSFNLGGEPLVENIEDAIATLKTSKIEYMYLPEIQKLVKVSNE